MAYKAPGVCDLYRENIGLNTASYAASGDADDFKTNTVISGMPARQTHVTDATAYATQPLTDNWVEHIRGKQGHKNDGGSQI